MKKINKFPDIITDEDIPRYKSHFFLTKGKLKEWLNEHDDIPDDALVMIQRIEDHYYENNHWGVYLKKGESYNNILDFSDEMRKEIERRNKGLEPEYPGIEDPNKYINTPTEKDMDQYHPAWCCVRYKDDNNAMFIDLHY